MKIKNIELLRNHVLEMMEKLSSGKVDLEEASITAKLSETVISSLKIQLEYSRLHEEKSIIPFIESPHKSKVIDSNVVKLVEKNE